MSLSEEDLQEIETRLRRAQVGPWIADTVAKVGEGWPLLFTLGDDSAGRKWVVQTNGVRASETNGATPEDDALFVAACRTDVPALLDEVRDLHREVMRLAAENGDLRQRSLFA